MNESELEAFEEHSFSFVVWWLSSSSENMPRPPISYSIVIVGFDTFALNQRISFKDRQGVFRALPVND